MNTLHMKYFTDVVQLGSISKAAQANHIAQPAMSRIIKSIEEEYAAALFERKGRNIFPNACGEIFYETAKKCLQLLSGAAEAIDATGDKFKGHVKIALKTPTVQISRLCKSFNQVYPDIFLDIQKPALSARELYNQNYDLLILMGPLPYHPNYESALLSTIRISCAVVESHPLAQKSSVSLNELARYPLTIPVLSGFGQLISSHFWAHNLSADIIGISENKTEHQILINSDPEHRVGLMMDIYAMTWESGYRIIPVEEEDFSAKLYMAWNSEIPLRSSVEMFRDYCIANYNISLAPEG